MKDYQTHTSHQEHHTSTDYRSWAPKGAHVVYSLSALLPGIDPEEEIAHIYVGVTSNLPARLRAHERKWWWPVIDLDLCELERFDTRAEAEAHERDMIRWYQPAINRSGRLLVVG